MKQFVIELVKVIDDINEYLPFSLVGSYDTLAMNKVDAIANAKEHFNISLDSAYRYRIIQESVVSIEQQFA